VRRAEVPWEARVEQAGADILSISETEVLLVTDDLLPGEPWHHPVWPLCRALGALGFGCVHLRGAEAFRYDFSLLMQGFPFAQESALRLDRGLPEETPSCEIVLHFGSDPDLQDACARLARSRSSHFASLSWGSTWVVMESLAAVLGDASVRGANSMPGAMPEEDAPTPVARIAAGLALQEALIVAGQLEAAAPPDPLVSFDAAAETRSHGGQAPAWPPVCIESSIIELIGAGAVGTHFLETFGPILGPGCELRIFDFDDVGLENLALQAAFSPEDVGRPKATVMAEKLAPMCHPALDLRPMAMRYEERPPTLSRPSLRVACPDSFAARKQANDCSIADGVPLVEAGSSPLASQERTYLPGRTACLEHRIPRLSERAASERERASCAADQAFTLPGTNMVCAGILAAEALRALQPEKFGWPSTGTVVYDAHFPERFGLIDDRPPCSHRRRVRFPPLPPAAGP
jgi:molybdopterin/thiamine biosynthesis adenylyltransferase